MDISYYREFLTLVETKNFWEASARLFINESSLSKHISRMEQELGVKLFDRGSRRIELTKYGKLMIPYAERIVNTKMEYEDAILDAIDEEHGVLMLGLLPDASRYRMTDLVVRFRNEWPESVVKAMEDDTLPLKEALRNHKIELAFLRESKNEPINDADFIKIPFMEDYMVALLPSSHPLAGKESISLGSLKDEKFILMKQQTYMFELQTDACRQAGFVPRPAFACNQLDTIIDLVARGMGIALLMNSQMTGLSDRGDRGTNAVVVPIMPVCGSEIYLTYRKKATLSETAKRFIACAEAMKDLGSNPMIG